MADDPGDGLKATLRISCLMPTRGRPHLLPRAVQCFLAQGAPDAELLIVSEDGLPDTLAEVLRGGRVRHVPCPVGLTLGAKRNLACEAARGDILVHWDDDDWQSPHRLARQAQALERPGVRVCGSSRVYFHELEGSRAWLYQYGGGRRPWVYGATLAYRRSYWREHPFPSITAGEDNAFVWAGQPAEVSDLDDPALCVAAVHTGNTSPKETENAWWQPVTLPPEVAAACSAAGAAGPAPLRNVYACLVHERIDCTIDLVRNLRHADPDSPILLYDGSPQGTLLDARLPWARWGVQIVPNPQPMKWGRLHGFAVDCLRHLRRTHACYDVMTNVDSDQLALRAGYTHHLARSLGGLDGLGLLSNDPAHQGPATRIPPAVTAQQELSLWRPWLKGFEDAESHWVHWTFWPQTAITRACGEAIAERFEHDRLLAATLDQSRLWATEEVLLPTLARLLGFRVARNPCNPRWVQYAVDWDAAQARTALAEPDAYWMHPVRRRYDDALRTQLRRAQGDYAPRRGAVAERVAPPMQAMLATMRSIEGWLADDEAERLHGLAIAAGERAAAAGREALVVEVGSYCGKGTFVLADALRSAGRPARVLAVDRFDGMVGAADRALQRLGPTLAKFRQTLERTGITPWVTVHVGGAPEQAEPGPVDLLVLDGLHDYASLVQDLAAVEVALAPDGVLALHDHADYFPDVGILVDELLASGAWQSLGRTGTLSVLARADAAAQIASCPNASDVVGKPDARDVSLDADFRGAEAAEAPCAAPTGTSA